MEKRKYTEKTLSKTPMRTAASCLSVESKDSPGEFSKLDTSSYHQGEGTIDSYVPKILNYGEWPSNDHESLSYLKYEMHTRQKFIDELVFSQEELKQNLSTLKAQNNSLHNELKICRNRVYDLDVDNYLLKETIANKDKEIERIVYEHECYKANEARYVKLAEENEDLKEQIRENKSKYEAKLKQSLRNYNQLNASLKESNEYIEKLKKRPLAGKTDPEDFLLKPRLGSSVKSFNLDKLKIPLGPIKKSSEKGLNMTERRIQTSSSIVTDIVKILNLESSTKILSAIIHLKDSHRSERKYKNFFKKLSLLVAECSPEGYFTEEPNIPQVWRWITLLLEEYMKIKQSH